jgi:hypothetical protein
MIKTCTTYKFQDPMGAANKNNPVYFAVMSDATENAVVLGLYIGRKFAYDESDKVNGCVRKGIVYQDEFLALE